MRSYKETMYQKDLENLGLSDKEAKTYLASLELGPTAVQEIAKKAGLKRPTTYFAIEQLIKKGLMSSFEKGKKRFFSAESPERLVSLVGSQIKKAQTLEEQLQRILPGLNTIFDAYGERPRVRFFEGKEGLKAIREDFLKSGVKSLESIYPREDFYKVFSKDERRKYTAKRKKRRIKARVIYAIQEGSPLKAKELFTERRALPYKKFPFTADITIYGNKVAIGTYKGKLIGVIIESKEIAETLRLIFNLAWEAAGRHQK
jgi:sugar-specific transcriptional regulator TrmB